MSQLQSVWTSGTELEALERCVASKAQWLAVGNSKQSNEGIIDMENISRFVIVLSQLKQ